jgi:hypothetical protein
MSDRNDVQPRGRQAHEVRFTVHNPDAPLSDEAIDAFARLLLSVSRQQPPAHRPDVAA